MTSDMQEMFGDKGHASAASGKFLREDDTLRLCAAAASTLLILRTLVHFEFVFCVIVMSKSSQVPKNHQNKPPAV